MKSIIALALLAALSPEADAARLPFRGRAPAPSAVEPRSPGITAAPLSARHDDNTYPTDPTNPYWYYYACYWDRDQKLGQAYVFTSTAMTVDLCVNTCLQKGYPFAGLQWGNKVSQVLRAIAHASATATTPAAIPPCTQSTRRTVQGTPVPETRRLTVVVILPCRSMSTTRMLPTPPRPRPQRLLHREWRYLVELTPGTRPPSLRPPRCPCPGQCEYTQ